MKLAEVVDTPPGNGIVQRKGKMTKKAIEDLDTDSVMNFIRHGTPQLTKFLGHLINTHWLGSSSIIKGVGEPNALMRGYEATPGAWVFDDRDTGITFVVFSDGHYKHPWKGSSIEVVTPVDKYKMYEAFVRLIAFLSEHSQKKADLSGFLP